MLKVGGKKNCLVFQGTFEIGRGALYWLTYKSMMEGLVSFVGTQKRNLRLSKLLVSSTSYSQKAGKSKPPPSMTERKEGGKVNVC